MLLLWLLAGNSYSFPVLVTLFVILFLISFFLVLRKRSGELQQIRTIINKIRNDKISSESEINLPENLQTIEDEIRQMYGRVQHDIEYLRKLERVRAEFLGNVSHELKTPIFAIQGFLETLLEGAIHDTKVNKLFLQKAARHTENLSNLVNDLIDISLIESGEMRLSFRYFDINQFIAEIIEEQLPFAQQKNLQLLMEAAIKETTVYGDKMKLKQVLTNLIQNAIKYTESGSITVKAEIVAKQVRIAVVDTGVGISAEHLPRVFERFYRIDKARSREAGGTGLGLAIVKHILEAHGSKVEVISQPGSGSEFFFFLKR